MKLVSTQSQTALWFLQKKKRYVSMKEFCWVLNPLIDTPELANRVQKLPDYIIVALSPGLVLPLLPFKYYYSLTKSR